MGVLNTNANHYYLSVVRAMGLRSASVSNQESTVYIAMNRFQISPGHEQAFEQVWLNRQSRLSSVEGFRDFVLLKGPTTETHTLYASHTEWESHAAFEAWTRSEAFRDAHKNAGDNRAMYLGHPNFEGFEEVVGSRETAV